MRINESNEQTRFSAISALRDKWVIFGDNPKVISEYLNNFLKLKSRKLIVAPQNDIGYWRSKTFNEFKVFVDGVMAKAKAIDDAKALERYWSGEVPDDNLPKKKAFDVVHSADEVVIKQPRSFEASCHLALGKSKWCLADINKPHYWHRYVYILGNTVYYMFFDNGDKKIAITVGPDGGIKNFWKQENVKLDRSEGFELLKRLGIPVGAFASRLAPRGGFEGELFGGGYEKIISPRLRSYLLSNFAGFGEMVYKATLESGYSAKLTSKKVWEKVKAAGFVGDLGLEEYIRGHYFRMLQEGKRYDWTIRI